MTYTLLGHTLHETANQSKDYFAREYGVSNFACEQEVEKDLPLKPTWQGTMQGGYRLCIEVATTPISSTLHKFVAMCAARRVPVLLWVALPSASGAGFVQELKEARELGIGVVQIAGDDATTHEFHKPVPLSLFGLRKTNLADIPKKWRASIKGAEDDFLGGSPSQGCQLICQHLEAVTRRFAQHSYANNWWKAGPAQKEKFFTVDSWAAMLEVLDARIDQTKVKAKCSSFKKAQIAGVRTYTDWRNSVSHQPKGLKRLQERDAKLRTMFEATRDLLVEWYEVARVLKLQL